jgi:hypothetical protein
MPNSDATPPATRTEGVRPLRLRHEQRAQARETIAVHAAACDEFGERIFEFRAQQVRAGS